MKRLTPLTTTLCVLLGGVMLAALVGCPRKTAPSVAADMAIADRMRASLDVGGAGGEEVVLADPTGWADIKGVITVRGAVPTMGQAGTHADCGAVPDTSIRVGQNNGLRDVLFFLSKGLGVNDVDEPNPKWVNEMYKDQEAAVFDQEKCIFKDRTFAVSLRQPLIVKNSDNFSHNTDITGVVNATIPGKSTYDVSGYKATRSPVPVACAIHPFMKANMMFLDDPYHAVSDAGGAFNIDKVPAGVDLEFRAWHEVSNYITEVTLNGESVEWKKGKFKVNLDPDQVYEMNIVIDASLLAN